MRLLSLVSVLWSRSSFWSLLFKLWLNDASRPVNDDDNDPWCIYSSCRPPCHSLSAPKGNTASGMPSEGQSQEDKAKQKEKAQQQKKKWELLSQCESARRRNAGCLKASSHVPYHPLSSLISQDRVYQRLFAHGRVHPESGAPQARDS